MATIHTRGWESVDFRRKSPFISETVRDKPMVLGAWLNSVIFDDLEWPLIRVSKLLYTYKSNISNLCVLGTKLLKNTIRKSYTIYPIVPLSMTFRDLWPRFQGHDNFRHWISQKRHEIQPWLPRTSIGSHMRSIEWWYSNDLDGPLTQFSRSRHFWSRISQKRCILGTKLLKNTNGKQ